MTDKLNRISLNELKLIAEPKTWQINLYLDNLPSLTPIRGFITAAHLGNRLNIKAKINTIITLRCDRCLKNYNQELYYDSEEIILIIEENPTKEINETKELKYDLIERMHKNEKFNPKAWVFEQMSLQLPLLSTCGTDCKGPDYQSKEEGIGISQTGDSDISIDPRWNELKKLL